MLNKEKMNEYSSKITRVLLDVLENEENENYIDIAEVEREDLNDEFMISFCRIAPFYLFKRISNIESNEKILEKLKELNTVIEYQISKRK